MATTCPNCHRDKPDEHRVCERCETKFTDDLKWLQEHLPDLEYRLNKANKDEGKGSGGASRANAPSPVRENIWTYLYGVDDKGNDGVETTLRVILRCLGNPMHDRMELTDMVQLIAQAACGYDFRGGVLVILPPNITPAILTSPAFPAHVDEIHRLRVTGHRLLDTRDEEHVILGPCANSECGIQLSAPIDEREVKCPRCGNVWTVGYLTHLREQRILNSGITAGQARLIELLAEVAGLAVNKSTMRSWVHRNQLKQAGEDEFSKPVYRLADAYQLATKDRKENAGEENTNLWNLVNAEWRNHNERTSTVEG
ncbi:MJ0042-type zinc finger domain-containing protein [Bifidobacterium eulemuris]|uniref:PhnA protein n=1 Tax=Bifidobacterium eulemuris TaxID=1765219 RepID=A0A261GA00_9BIFI|nr:MJ0042-type zinc finger domain-containing protein [Bifidobacterium eulemuris]OZG68240.1 hypothetical protein BEUL_1253 [Bifidobacterium eulemuris]QOL31704.1 hypothetical protein BE0216_03925 [Bifidobacterium eulemuris]